jgi:hypothetical protein
VNHEGVASDAFKPRRGDLVSPEAVYGPIKRLTFDIENERDGRIVTRQHEAATRWISARMFRQCPLTLATTTPTTWIRIFSLYLVN